MNGELETTIVGIDGCKAGWIAVVKLAGAAMTTRVAETFAQLSADLPANSIVVVDIPIGLSARTIGGGRVAEQAARSVLRRRSSSVFSVPSRSAVFLELGPFGNWDERSAARSRAHALALQTSSPARGISHQAFAIFPKIREVDEWIRSRRETSIAIYESHPEIAFYLLNNRREMSHSKKSADGSKERIEILISYAISEALLTSALPRDVARDDLLDAAAMLLVAARIARREAVPFPDPPAHDEYGIPIAIWA